MKLSIIVPTNRTSLSARARILEACACAGEDVEVIIRDNSGDAEKAEFLSHIKVDNCRIVTAGGDSSEAYLGGAYENFTASLAMAQGRFVMFFADDDWISRIAIHAVLREIDICKNDSSVAGITGDYAIETDLRTFFTSYPPLDSHDAAERCKNNLLIKDNVLLYSALRRDFATKAIKFTGSALPFFPIGDVIFTLIVLMSGRFLNIRRLLCCYNLTEVVQGGINVQKFYSFYKSAGLDPSILLLHGLIIAYQGAKVALCPFLGENLSDRDRQAIAATWYGTHASSLAAPPLPYADVQGVTVDPKIEKATMDLRRKWLNKSDIALDELLADLSGCMTLSNPSAGYEFRNFWGRV